MVVPEQRHLLGERRGRHQHLGEPPGSQLERLLEHLAQRELAVLGAHAPEPAQRFEGLVSPGRQRGGRRFPGPRQQAVHPLFASKTSERLDVGRSGGEAGAVEQVPGVVEAERRRCVSRSRNGTAKNAKKNQDSNRTAKACPERVEGTPSQAE